MPRLDQKRVQEAIDRAYDAEVAHLFKILLENMTEVASGGAGSGGSRRQANASVLSRAV
jgi:hypothetical protein